MAKQSPKSQKKGAAVKEYLESLPPAELVSYLLDVARRTPKVQRDLEHRAVLASSDAGELLDEARKEFGRLRSERQWNDWKDCYKDADYRHLKALFKKLLDAGQTDALLELGQELLGLAGELMKDADADEPSKNLLACFKTVFQAVPSSSKSDIDKMMYLIDLSLADEDDLTEEMNFLFEREWPTAVWSAVADEMTRRLDPDCPAQKRVRASKRDELNHWLHQALEATGRDEEVLPILEREAVESGTYLHLVDTLIGKQRWDDARRWILEGIQKKHLNPTWSASTLLDRWRHVAEHHKDWGMLAAMAADSFFWRPHTDSFRELIKTAKKARCEETVRAAALGFLETGMRPDSQEQPAAKSRSSKSSAKKAVPAVSATAWPLPALPAVLSCEVRSGPAEARGPRYDVLLKLAVAEKKPDEVLRWYDRLTRTPRERNAYGYDWSDYRSEVADAVADTHPDRAEALYRDLIAGHLAFTNVSAYEAAEPYLVRLKALLTRNKRAAEWTQYLNGLREAHFRKPRLIEVLDRVEGGRSRR